MRITIYTTTAIFFLLIMIGLPSCRQGSQKKTESGSTAREGRSKGAADAGEFGIQMAGNEGSVDMSQFPMPIINIYYVANDNQRHLLDIAYPFYGRAPYKPIVLFHGGGWMAGDKQSATLAPIFQATAQGYAVISVNYRLSDEVKWPRPLHDAKAAIRFIRANAKKYRLDAEKIVVWGVSAGGHIALMLAATNDLPEFEDLSLGNPGVSSAVQGVVSWYGVSDISNIGDPGLEAAGRIMGFDVRTGSDRTREASPVELVTKNFPPALLVHGTADQIVPYNQSVEMQKKINDVTGKTTAELKSFEGASHGDAKIKASENVMDNLNFIDRILYDGNNPYRNDKTMNVKIIN